MAHDALDAWLDQIETDTPDSPRLLDLSEQFLAPRAQLLGACLEAVIRQQYAADLEQIEAVCACGRRLAWRRLDAKEISTLHGRVTLHRPYFYCEACGTGFHPLDAKLGLSPKHHQYDIQERTTRVGAELPFGLSEAQCEHLTGVPAPQHFIHETLNAVGEAARSGSCRMPRRSAGASPPRRRDRAAGPCWSWRATAPMPRPGAKRRDSASICWGRIIG